MDLNFDVSTGLKDVLGRELITNDEVAIFELVKNSFDAGARQVNLFFDNNRIVVADDGSGMTYDDIQNKWLFVAYSSKRQRAQNSDFRHTVAERAHYAGSKGIGRFSSDRLGHRLTLETRTDESQSPVHRLSIDWARFELDEREHFERIPVSYETRSEFSIPDELTTFVQHSRHGTTITITELRRGWSRDDLLALKSSLAKLINPFGSEADSFSIHIIAPAEQEYDESLLHRAAVAGEEPSARAIVNGKVGNFIFSDLRGKTTFITVEINDDVLETRLTDRGELIYHIKEPCPYNHLKDAGFRTEIYYLNHAAKITFARRVGLASVKFGSVFLFRNGFRVYPVGNDDDDWFGFNRRKQQGYTRFLGSREVIGRVDVFGSDADFQEASSRNQGLIDTPAVRQLKEAVMDHGLKRLEKYVVPVSWVDKADGEAEDLSRLLTDPGRVRVSTAVANLVDNDNVQLVSFSRRLINLVNERTDKFESTLVSLRTIAEKAGDDMLRKSVDAAEKRFEDLQRAEAEARKVADRERAVARAATERAVVAETAVEHERRRAHFLESVVNLDTATILNLHHQVTIYSVDVSQQIENFLAATVGQETVRRDVVLHAMEQMAFLNRKIHAVTKFAAKANFQLDSGHIEADLAAFTADYITNVAQAEGSARLRIEVENEHPGFVLRFNPIDVSIVVDNLISNARRARASNIRFAILSLEKTGFCMITTDNGQGISRGANPERFFEMGYTTSGGSGLGLYHVQQVLGSLGGGIEVDSTHQGRGVSFVIKIYKKVVRRKEA